MAELIGNPSERVVRWRKIVKKNLKLRVAAVGRIAVVYGHG
jgi:hypothetical protein